jgi:hypothetical protein
VIKVQGEEGQTAEIWRVDVSGGVITQLGSTVLGPGWTPATLSTALVVDQRIRLNYVGSTQYKFLRTWAQWPQIVGVDRPLVEVTGTTLQIKGVNIAATTLARLLSGPELETETSLSLSFVDSETASVAVPALPATEVGGAVIQLYEPGQPPTEYIPSIRVMICE